jgi:hypothetical protein
LASPDSCSLENDQVYKYIDSSKSCGEASDRASQCALGSSVDTLIAGQAQKFCEKNFFDELTALEAQAYDRQLTNCDSAGQEEGTGTLRRSIMAFCRLGQAVSWGERTQLTGVNASTILGPVFEAGARPFVESEDSAYYRLKKISCDRSASGRVDCRFYSYSTVENKFGGHSYHWIGRASRALFDSLVKAGAKSVARGSVRNVSVINVMAIGNVHPEMDSVRFYNVN